MRTRGYPVRVYQEADGTWAAEVPDLPGCVAGGDTPEELFERLEDAIEEWIHSAELDGEPVPQPSRPSTYSGRFVARFPPSLHEQLAWRAEREGVSLNQLVVVAVTTYLARGAEPAAEPVRWRDLPWSLEGNQIAAGHGHRVFFYGPVGGGFTWEHEPEVASNVIDLDLDRQPSLVQ